MLSRAAEAIVQRVTDPGNAVEPARFPRDRDEAARPGIYAWWGDEDARDTLGTEVGNSLPSLLYVGQAGATSWPSGRRSSATLASRIKQQHLRGNERSSTFRLTISALLFNRLHLVAASGGRLDRASNQRVSEWIAGHLLVAVASFDDRDALADIEAEVVAYLDPPLNLDHCPPSDVRMRLTELRSVLARRGAPGRRPHRGRWAHHASVAAVTVVVRLPRADVVGEGERGVGMAEQGANHSGVEPDVEEQPEGYVVAEVVRAPDR
jgi:hypothetical protein